MDVFQNNPNILFTIKADIHERPLLDHTALQAKSSQFPGCKLLELKH